MNIIDIHIVYKMYFFYFIRFIFEIRAFILPIIWVTISIFFKNILDLNDFFLHYISWNDPLSETYSYIKFSLNINFGNLFLIDSNEDNESNNNRSDNNNGSDNNNSEDPDNNNSQINPSNNNNNSGHSPTHDNSSKKIIIAIIVVVVIVVEIICFLVVHIATLDKYTIQMKSSVVYVIL